MNGTYRWPLGFAAGLAAIGCYVAFTAAAYLLDPGPFGPADNWLSDLGSSTHNPTGVLVYNVGVGLTGLALVGFLWAFTDWAERSSRQMRSRLNAVRILGVIGGLTTAATAAVPESLNADLHGWISMWGPVRTRPLIQARR